MTFAPGQNDSRVTVAGIPNGTNLAWTLQGQTVTASASFAPSCSGPPPEPEIEPPDRPIGVFVACVTQSGGRYDAVFGYQNENPTSVKIAVGDRNRFDPAPVGRGQVTEFLPGNVQRAFVVRGVSASASVMWSVTHAGATRSATATASESQRCAEAPEPLAPIGIFACVTPRGDAFDVSFGYDNPNSVAVSVPIGIANAVLPRPIRHGQPDVFEPGRVERAFTVRGVRDTRLVVLDRRVLRTLLARRHPHVPDPLRGGAPSGPHYDLPALRNDGQARRTSRSSATRTSTSGTSMSHADPRTASAPVRTAGASRRRSVPGSHRSRSSSAVFPSAER